MPRNGAGSFNLVAGNPVVTNTTISSTWANNTLSDIAGALTQSISKDGQTTPTANLPMGGFKMTNMAAGNAPGNSLRYEQLFSQGIPSDIASAGTVDIGGEYNTFLNVTGNTTITSFGTNYNGPRFLTFKASLTITHDATDLVLPDGENIVTQAGDVAIFIPKCTVSGTSDGWRLVSYLRANNVSLVNDTVTIASAATLNFTTSQAQFFSITGATDVAAVTMYEAQPVYAIAAGAFKLVNSTSLAIQGGADYTCAVGDVLCFIKDGAGNIHVFGIIPLANTANDPTLASDSASKAASTQWVNDKALIITNAKINISTGSTFYEADIPSGVKNIKIIIVTASTSGTSNPILRLVTSSGVVSTGYVSRYDGWASTPTTQSTTVGFGLTDTSIATGSMSCTINIDYFDGLTWKESHIGDGLSGPDNFLCAGSGYVTLTEDITKIRLTTINGTDTFDAGSMMVSWQY